MTTATALAAKAAPIVASAGSGSPTVSTPAAGTTDAVPVASPAAITSAAASAAGTSATGAQASRASVVLRASASVTDGVGTSVTINYNGNPVGTVEVRSSTPVDHAFTLPVATPSGTLDVVVTNASDAAGTTLRALKVESVTIGSTLMRPADSGIVFDRGDGVTAFDGQDVLPGRALLNRNGALRISIPTAAQLDARTSSSLTAPGVYIDSASGSDTNPGSVDRPWRTLARAAAAVVPAGQTIYLRCGSVWRESLALNPKTVADGTVVAGYGTDCAARKAVISGADDFSGGWTLSAGIWSRNLPAGTPKISQLFINGEPLRTAQWPNAGTLGAGLIAAPTTGSKAQVTVQAADVTAIGQKDLAGATMQVRTQPWYVETRTISSRSNATLALAAALEWPVSSGTSYVLQDKLWMLDAPGEFFHDTATQKLYLIAPSVGAPANLNEALLEGSVRDVAVAVTNRKAIALRDVQVRAARAQGVYAVNAPQLQVAGIEAFDNGESGVRVELFDTALAGSPGPSISDSVFSGNATFGIKTYDVAGARISGNRVLATGTNPQHLGGVQAAIGAGPGAQTTDNVVDGAGYHGIAFSTLGGSRVAGNSVSGYCARLWDCGAIYTWQGRANAFAAQSATVENNRVLAAPLTQAAAAAAIAAGKREVVVGIYLDDMTSGVTVRNNLLANVPVGVFLHNAFNITVQNNRIWMPTLTALWASMDQTDADWMRGNVLCSNEIVPFVQADAAAGSLPSFIASQAVWFWHAIDGPAALGGARNQFCSNTVTQLQGSVAAHAIIRGPAGERTLDAAGWKALNAGETMPLQPARFDPWNLQLGAELVAGGALDQGLGNWVSYRDPSGSGFAIQPLSSQAGCTAGCVALSAGSQGDLIGSGTFSMRAGAMYVYRWTATSTTGAGAVLGQPYISRAGSPFDQMSDGRGFLGYRTRQLVGTTPSAQEYLFIAKAADAARVNLQLETLRVPVALDAVSVREVTSYTVARAGEWAALAFAPRTTARIVGCAELGWPSGCSALGIDGVPVPLPLQMAAGTERLLLRADSPYRR